MTLYLVVTEPHISHLTSHISYRFSSFKLTLNPNLSCFLVDSNMQYIWTAANLAILGVGLVRAAGGINVYFVEFAAGCT